MDRVAVLPPGDRSDLFRAAAERKGVSVQIIEKDFWVCWVLRQFSGLDGLPAPLYFKGGTSLSKVFGVIDRMSEDIDLVIDREGLGFTGNRDPAAENLGTNARQRLIDELKEAAGVFVIGPLTGTLQARFTEVLGNPNGWRLEPDLSDPQNPQVHFQYPTKEEPAGYLRPRVLFELGARGDTWPAVDGDVWPYAADIYPDQFTRPSTSVRTITAEPTFWEKVTFLHTLTHRPADRVAAAQPARHLLRRLSVGQARTRPDRHPGH